MRDLFSRKESEESEGDAKGEGGAGRGQRNDREHILSIGNGQRNARPFDTSKMPTNKETKSQKYESAIIPGGREGVVPGMVPACVWKKKVFFSFFFFHTHAGRRWVCHFERLTPTCHMRRRIHVK
jgi:hypothetical protein